VFLSFCTLRSVPRATTRARDREGGAQICWALPTIHQGDVGVAIRNLDLAGARLKVYNRVYMFESTGSQAGNLCMEELTISEVARRSGVRATTIRYYESINVLPEPRRANGRRRYDPAIVERLAFIHVAQRLGFSLTEIGLLFEQRATDAPLSERWQALAREKLADVERLIRHARTVRQTLLGGLRCSCDNLDECIDCVLRQCA
jgi:MerR family redox-sensitive transcriptional activator SoxR